MKNTGTNTTFENATDFWTLSKNNFSANWSGESYNAFETKAKKKKDPSMSNASLVCTSQMPTFPGCLGVVLQTFTRHVSV